MGSILDMGAEKRAKKQAAMQQEQLDKQKQKEDLRAAEAEDEVSRRKGIAAKGGSKASLLATSEAGVTAAASMKPALSKTMGG